MKRKFTWLEGIFILFATLLCVYTIVGDARGQGSAPPSPHRWRILNDSTLVLINRNASADTFFIVTDSVGISYIQGGENGTVAFLDVLKILDFELYTGGAVIAAYDTADVPTDGQQLTFKTGPIITWEDPAAGGGTIDSAIIDFGSAVYKSSSVKAWSMKAGSNITFTTPTDSAGIDTFTIDGPAGGGTTDTVAFVFRTGNATKYQVDKAIKIRYGDGFTNTVITDSAGTDTITLNVLVASGVAIDADSAVVAKPGTGLDTTGGTIFHIAHTSDVTGATELTIQDDAVQESDVDITNTATTGQLLTKGSGDNFTYSGLEDIIAGTNDSLRWLATGDSALVIVSDESGNIEITVGQEGDGTPITLKITADTVTVALNLTLPLTTASFPLTEGLIRWDTDDDQIRIGAGGSNKVFVPTDQFSADATVSTAGVVVIQDNAVQESDVDITNTATTGQVLTKGSGDNFTWSGLEEIIAGTDDSLRWIIGTDTAFVLALDPTNNDARLTVGTGMTFSAVFDTLFINGVAVTDLEGTNLSITGGVLNATGGTGLWDSTAVVNIDSFFLVGRNNDTALFVTMDTLQDTITIDFGQSEGQTVRIRNVNRIDTDTVTVNAVPIIDFEGTNLSVTAGVLNATSGARWVNVGTADSVSLVGASDTLMLVADTGAFSSIETQNASGFMFLDNFTMAGNNISGVDALLIDQGTGTELEIAGSGNQLVFVHGNGGNGVRILMDEDNTGAGDADVSFRVGPTTWTIGADNTDADAFVLSRNATLGTNNVIKITTSDVIEFNSAYTFPTADGGANQVLQTDGAGALTFQTVSGASLWDSTAVVNIDSFYVVGRNNDTAMFIVMDTLQDTISIDFGQSEGQTVRIRNVNRIDTDTVTVNAVPIIDFEGTNLSVTAGVLNAAGGSGAFDDIDGGQDTARYVAPNGDTALIVVSDNSGNTEISVGLEGDGTSSTLKVTADTVTVSLNLTLPLTTASFPLTEGLVRWDTDDDQLRIGASGSNKVFIPTDQFSTDAAVSVTGVVTIQDDAVQESDVDITNTATTGQILTKGSGDNFTWSGLEDIIAGTDDSLRWIAAGDTALLITSSEAGDTRITVGQESDATAITLSIVLDTIVISGDNIIDFAGAGLVVTSGVLDASVSGGSSAEIVDNTVTMADDMNTFTKAELETQTTDVANFAEADGDVFTGVHDFGGVTTFELWNATNPATAIIGQLAVDVDDTSLELYDGVRSVQIPMHFTKSILVYNPDLITDTVPIFTADSAMMQGGFTITHASIIASVDGAYTLELFEFTSADPPVRVGGGAIGGLIIAAADQRADTVTFSDPTIAVGNELYLDTPATDIEWIKVEIRYFIIGND